MLTLIDDVKIFNGNQLLFEHESSCTKTPMRFAAFIPNYKQSQKKLASIIYLSGLTCNWENVMTKAGAQRFAQKYNIIFVAPDTSPRGPNIPDDESYDLGQGAGFYLNATQKPWNKNYKMYDYIVNELTQQLKQIPQIDTDRISIMGHSMGGHGALTMAIKNPKIFKSVSALAPICAPTQCPWGIKAFTAYLGEDKQKWHEYDTCSLLEKIGYQSEILVDQGANDNFLNEQLLPQNLNAICKSKKIPLKINIRAGFDHSYYFITSFIEDHIKWHAKKIG